MTPSSPDPLDSLPIAMTEASEAPTAGARRPPPSLTQARLLVLAAATLWSMSGLFVKAPWFVGWSGAVLAFWRAFFASLVLVPLVRRAEWSWKLIPMTAFFAAMNYTYLTSMAEGTAANAIWLQFTAPAWVLLFGILVFKEHAVWQDWLLMAFAVAGVAIIVHFESQGASRSAILWGLASGACYAGVVLCLRNLRTHDPAWLAAINHIVTAVLLVPFAFAPNLLVADAPPFPSGIQWPLLAALGIFQMGLPYVLLARGLQRIPGHEVTGIGLIEPILVPLWTFLAWNERPAWWTIAGGALILAGLAIRYLTAVDRDAAPSSRDSQPSSSRR